MLLALAIALGLTASVPQLRQRESFVLFFGAVTLSAWYGGRGPGLISCILAALFSNYFIFEPAFAFALTIEAIVPLIVFVCTALAISSLTSELARSEQQLRSLASEVLLAEERERRRIAVGLHDRVGQTLAACNMRVHRLLNEPSQEVVRQELLEINKSLKEILSETRSLTFELSPPTLYEFGLEPALKWLAEQISKKYGVACLFSDSGKRVDLNVEFRVVLFQAARELLMNVIKHAEAKQASLLVENSDDAIKVIVEDDGLGFNADEFSTPEDGYGLFSIRERLRHIGGRLEICSRPQAGAQVTLMIPMNCVTLPENQ